MNLAEVVNYINTEVVNPEKYVRVRFDRNANSLEYRLQYYAANEQCAEDEEDVLMLALYQHLLLQTYKYDSPFIQVTDEAGQPVWLSKSAILDSHVQIIVCKKI